MSELADNETLLGRMQALVDESPYKRPDDLIIGLHTGKGSFRLTWGDLRELVELACTSTPDPQP